MKNIDIYDLSQQKFEELALNFLQEQVDLISVEFPGPGKFDSGYDFSAKLNKKNETQLKIAIEAKHRKRLSKQDLNRIADSAAKIKGEFEGFILITSAKLSQDEQDFLTSLIQLAGYSFIRIYQGITFESLAKASNNKTIEKIIKSKKTEKLRLFLGSITIATSLATLVAGLTPYIEEKKDLDARIGSVVGALDNIKNLEKQLFEIKTDMQKTQRESEKIQQEYEKSQALKLLTKDQQNALRAVIGVSNPPWWSKPLDYLLGFIFGIGASIVASIIHDKIKRNRVLNSPA